MAMATVGATQAPLLMEEENLLEENAKDAQDMNLEDADFTNYHRTEGATGGKGLVFSFTPLHTMRHGTVTVYINMVVCRPRRAGRETARS